tara:strand:+ start:17616 stop:19673 length:2058 start_codon:yes stop_codon:yes gene_type:complete
MTARATKTKTQFEFPHAENLALKRGRKKLLALQSKITALHFAVGREVGKLRAAVPADRLRGALVAECGVPDAMVATYLNLQEQLGEHETVLCGRAVPAAVLKDLVESDASSRNVTLLRIASESLVSHGQAAASAKDSAMAAISTARRAEIARRRFLGRIAARRTVKPVVEAFEASIRALSISVDEFRSRNPQIIQASFKGYDRINHAAPAYRAGYKAIREQALPVLRDFERIYGDRHPPSEDWAETGRKRPEAVKLAMGHEALKRFADGRFGHRGGFGFNTTSRSLGDGGMLSALQYLSCEPLPLARHRSSPTIVPGRLRAIELCAGIGGQALGLEAAGFDIVAAYENSKPAVKALRSNRPGLNVLQQDIAAKPEEAFAQYTGKIDLISGGLPCQPYSGRGDGNGQFDKRDLFPTAVKIVKTVRPRAFFFENVEGFTFYRHSSHRAKIISDFAELGYIVQIRSINSKIYGVPQDRRRVIVLGLSKDIAHRFQIPKAPADVARDLGTAIADLLFPYQTKAGPGRASELSKVQQRYDEWADWWLDKFGSGAAPTLTRPGGSARYTTSWKKAGFDPSGVAAFPPGLTEVAIGYLPKVTIPILKRLQGLPDDWVIAAAESTQAQQLANAFPPHAARAIGIALRQALSGESLDFARILKQQIPMPMPNFNRGGADHPDRDEDPFTWTEIG